MVSGIVVVYARIKSFLIMLDGVGHRKVEQKSSQERWLEGKIYEFSCRVSYCVLGLESGFFGGLFD